MAKNDKTTDTVPAPQLPFRAELSALIAAAKVRGVPIEQLQSAMHSEGDIIDKEFDAAVARTKKQNGKV